MAPPASSPAIRRLRRRGWGRLALAAVWLAIVVAFEVVGYLLTDVLPVDEDTLLEVAGAIGALLGCVALGGARLLSPTPQAARASWKALWPFVAISAALMCWDLAGMLADGATPVADWALRLAETAVLCLAIGVLEECSLRGLLLGGLLAPLGRTRGGMWAAIIVSSLVFGALHIDFSTLDWTSALDVAQAALKVAQTGIYGFALACVVVADDDILSPALAHGLDDFLLFVVSVVLLGDSTDVEYVSSDAAEAVSTIWLYVIMCALYLPVAVHAARLLRGHPVPERGAFMERAERDCARELSQEAAAWQAQQDAWRRQATWQAQAPAPPWAQTGMPDGGPAGAGTYGQAPLSPGAGTYGQAPLSPGAGGHDDGGRG